jgi:hypothetical protein
LKFVTKRVYNTWSYEPWGKAFASYDEHLEQLKAVVPDSIIELASPALLDDGLILFVDHDRQKKTLELKLRCGNLQIGYFDIVIKYLGASITDKHDQTLSNLAASTNGFRGILNDIHFHEFSVRKDGRIVHRFLFNPGTQFAITCKSLTWKKIARKDRRFPKLQDRYPGGPPPDRLALTSDPWLKK